MNPIFLIDFYKVGHVSQYPRGITRVWSNWTPRSSRTAEKSVVHFGLQYFIKKYLIESFQNEFFTAPLRHIVSDYQDVIRATLGVQNPRTDHIEALWHLGHLPLEIYSLPEGTVAPLRVPSMVISNTVPEMFWLPNYLETLLSTVLWKPSTSATTARAYRRLFNSYARKSGETDLSFVDWQGHDFSFRGMAGVEDATLSGMGHLLSFSGTDSVPAIISARKYYGADLTVGGSVPATEHSVMCAGSKAGEFETFKRLITETYPRGVVSIVSDTWDLWKVLTDYVPRLKDEILSRNGKVVIRPDSGDPVKIICGDPDATHSVPARLGTLRLLAEALGTEGARPGLPRIKNAGAIYGDSITLERADAILDRTVNELRMSPFNLVFGIGSFTYCYVTRDTYGFAMKATAVEQDGKIVPIFKSPVTDDGMKKSLCGIPSVFLNEMGRLEVSESNDPESLKNCAYDLVFKDGELLKEYSFSDIRERVRADL